MIIEPLQQAKQWVGECKQSCSAPNVRLGEASEEDRLTNELPKYPSFLEGTAGGRLVGHEQFRPRPLALQEGPSYTYVPPDVQGFPLEMRAELMTELDTEQVATGRSAASRHVYALFRCPGPPCDLKPWCWFDSTQNKRYGLKSHHLRTLMRHKDSGEPLDTHDQLPEDLRQQIYQEERQFEDQKQTNNMTPSSGILPIQITSALPKHTSLQAETALKTVVSPVEISGLRDDNVRKYCEWQQSQVRNPSLKAEFQKATDFVVERGLDLELLHEDQNLNFLLRKEEYQKELLGDTFETLNLGFTVASSLVTRTPHSMIVSPRSKVNLLRSGAGGGTGQAG